jgi:glyoxylase-like metal-dependent hydrolase (beta-lactamase superfamily II)
MSACPSFLKVAPGVVTWSTYSEECKTYCFGHAHIHLGNLVLIDPILSQTEEIWSRIIALGKPNLIILTNGNHERHARKVAKEYDLPVAAAIEAISELSQKPDIILDGQLKLQGLRPYPCAGAGPGETALFSESSSTLILGDSIINLPETGLQLLPDNYCSDPRQLKKSLATLLNLPFKNLIMAHGIPLTDNPKRQLKSLLTS